MSGQMALCPVDGAPLICTFAWSRAEFYCLDCGGHFGWLDPSPGDPNDPDLERRYQAVLAEWQRLGGPDILSAGLMLTDCETCKTTGRSHIEHATDAEREASANALDALKARATAERVAS